MNDTYKILTSPLPQLTPGESLSEDQWKTFMAIGDAIIGDLLTNNDAGFKVRESIRSALGATCDDSSLDEYLSEEVSCNTEIQQDTHRLIVEYLRPDARDGLRSILSALKYDFRICYYIADTNSTRLGSLLLTGSINLIQTRSIEERQRIILAWTQSYIPQVRMIGKTFINVFKASWVKTSASLYKVIGFPRVPVHGTQGKGYDYNFIQFPRTATNTVELIDTDILIIGSGCGGAVCAKNLAEAGHRVIVVDQGLHYPPEYLPMTQHAGSVHLFENGGAEFSDDSSIIVGSGKAWGGGGTVNWSASLQTEFMVRKEWSEKDGLTFFNSPDFQHCLDRVCARMGVSTKYVKHNRTNQILIDGAKKLGLNAKEVPQNTGGKQHYCGYCTYGCGSAEKQGPVVSWLPDAAEAGARFIEGFSAESLIFANENDMEKRAVGARGTWKSRNSTAATEECFERKVEIRASQIVVSCGTLRSPLLLLRSGLQNPHIGRNLHLHPVTVVGAVFPETTNPWEGGILTAAVDSLHDLDGQGHGVKIEACTMLPALALPWVPWTSAAEWKLAASKFKNMVSYITLCRDKDSGQVYPDKATGQPRIAYNPSKFDRKHIMEGIIAIAKIVYAEGALEIIHPLPGVPTFKRDWTEDQSLGINSPSFQKWLALVRKHGLPDPDSSFASAHQMGTCRMSRAPEQGVVDPNGRIWGVSNVYVSDASVFPSASGVNPMVTNMAISDWISCQLVQNLSKKKKHSVKEVPAKAML